MLKDYMKDKRKLFYEKDTFKNIKLKPNLPRITTLSKKYKDDIRNNVIILHYQKKIMNPIELNNKERKSIFTNIFHNKDFIKKIKLKEKILPTSLSEKKIFKRNLILKHPKSNIQLNENHSTISFSLIKNLSTNNNEDLNSHNTINSEFKTSRSCNKNLLLPNIKIKREFIRSIDNIETDADESFDFYHNKFKRNSNYEKKMIKKCNNNFKELEKKIQIQNYDDEFFDGNYIGNKVYTNEKFNEFFDRIISNKKQFDHNSIMDILRNLYKKRKLREKINKLKMKNNRNKLFKIIKDNNDKAKQIYELLNSSKNKSN